MTERIFKMAPIHHHYEKGWPESTFLLDLNSSNNLRMIGLATLKFR